MQKRRPKQLRTEETLSMKTFRALCSTDRTSKQEKLRAVPENGRAGADGRESEYEKSLAACSHNQIEENVIKN
jgi:hypothetical protein